MYKIAFRVGWFALAVAAAIIFADPSAFVDILFQLSDWFKSLCKKPVACLADIWVSLKGFASWLKTFLIWFILKVLLLVQ